MKIDKLNILIIFMSIMKLSKFTLFIFILFFPLLGTSYDISNLPELIDKINPAVVRIETTGEPNNGIPLTGDPFFDDFPLVKQSRLSVMPVKLNQWKKLIKMSEKK